MVKMKRISVTIEEQYANILETLPNKSRFINNLLASLFGNAKEDDLMKIVYVYNNTDSLRREIHSMLQRSLGIESYKHADKAKSSKSVKQTTKETKEKEQTIKTSIPIESWW